MRVRSSSRPAAGTALLLVCTTLALACNEQRPPPPAARFDRPNRVAFLCARDATVLPLADCRTPVVSGDTLALYALVTQAGRGEIAAVNLRRRKVLDTRREIPGFTYQPVGEAPSAVVVPAAHPSHTYVASFGSRDLRVVRTRTLVAAVDEAPLAQTVPLALPETGERVSPTSMVITPDERALVLGLPDVGKLLVVPLVRCAAGASDCEDGLIDEAGIRSVDLGASVGRIADREAIEPARYQRLCGYERSSDLPRALSPAIPDGALERSPRPSALVVDPYCAPDMPCAPRILVADDSLPFLHVLDIAALLAGGDPVLAPLVTGVPTSAVAVTPHVPRAVGDPEGSTQYVYAVDATDGSVLVLEGGFVLEVNDNSASRRDRILLNAGRPAARAIAVLTPTFDVNGTPHQHVEPGHAAKNFLDDGMCFDDEHDEEVPARLRGVFLAVASSDGLVRIIDVHDMELLDAQRGDDACRACPADDPVPLVVRHQPRVGTSFVPGSGDAALTFVPGVNLSFQLEDIAYQVRTDGTTASPAAPGLACMACGEGRVRVYPTTDPDEAAPATDGGVPDGGADAGLDAATPSEPMAEPEPAPDPALLPGVDPLLTDAGFDAAVPDDEVVIPTCPSDRPALVCASDDPWSVPEELYTALYEGVLYRGGTSLGRLAAPGDADNRTGALELLIDFDACGAGVLGEEDMAPEYAGCDEPPAEGDLAAHDGDQVVLVSRPLGASALEERMSGDPNAERVISRCATLTEALEDPDLPTRAAFEIRRAYADRLVLNGALIDALGRVRTFADLAPCYESPLSFEVRSYHAFTVTGGGTGFAHRVRANAAGRCQVDPDGDALLRGRARLGCTFENHVIELRFGADARDTSVPPPAGTRFEIVVTHRARKVFLDARQVGFSPATVVATDLAWNPIDERMYLVDIADRGLLPITVDPVPSALGTSYQYR